MLREQIGNVDSLQTLLLAQRKSFLDDFPVSLEIRQDRLDRGLAMILAHRQRLVDAVMQDFPNRGAEWTLLAEIFVSTQVFQTARKQVHRWMRSQRRGVPAPFNLFGARAEIQYQPLGVVGIMGAWNAPLNLVLVPLATVLAAGNRAMVCPSDMMPATAAALDEAVKAYFDATEVAVVRGGLEVSKAFSHLALDHLMFTGSPQVGAAVMAAAAPNLVPVTLELGGKCPVVIAPDADLDDAAQRLIAAKTYNGGQACLAPDQLFVPRAQLEPFIAALDAAAEKLFPGGAGNADYCGLLNQRYYQRIEDIIEQARGQGSRVVVLGAKGAAVTSAPALRRIALHLLIDPPADSRASSEELFGPVMVVSTYNEIDQACQRIRNAPKPLGLYVFSRSAALRQWVLDRTFSGGATLNDAIFHYSVPELPFGGVGRSGMGVYSFGIEGFRRFSHARSVYRQAGPRSLMRVMQPPYGRLFEWMVRGGLDRLARHYASKVPRKLE